jgi:rubrerythrin
MIAPDYWQAQESQDAERHSEPPVRWICPYCGHEVADERTPCCGEIHAMPMTEDERENV